MSITKKIFFIIFIVLQFLLAQENTKFLRSEVIWKFKVNSEIISSPIIENDILYFGANDNNFYAIDSKNSEIKWKYKTNGAITGKASIFENKVCFLSKDGFIYLLNIDNGSLIWKFQTRGEKDQDYWDYYLSQPIVVENVLCFGSGDSYIYGLDKKTGEKLWEVKTNGIVHSTPAVINNNIYLGSYDGNFYSINTLNGKVNWKFKTVGNISFKEGAIQGSAEVVDSVLVFGSRDYNVYAVNSVTGTGMWNQTIGSWVVAKPILFKKRVYFGNSDNTFLWSMGSIIGNIRLKIPVNLNVFADVVFFKDFAAFSSFNGKIYFVDINSNKIVYEFQTEASKLNYSKIFDENDKERKEIRENLETMKDYGDLYNKIYFSLGSILGTPLINKNMLYIPTTEGVLYAIKLIEN